MFWFSYRAFLVWKKRENGSSRAGPGLIKPVYNHIGYYIGHLQVQRPTDRLPFHPHNPISK